MRSLLDTTLPEASVWGYEHGEWLVRYDERNGELSSDLRDSFRTPNTT